MWDCPIDIARYAILPGRRLAQICAVVRDSSALASLWSAAEGEKARLVRASVWTQGGAPMRACAILDVTDCGRPEEELDSALRGAGGVISASLKFSPVEGFAALTSAFPVVADGMRAVIFREGGYRELLAGIREYFGACGESFLYHVGFRAGMGFARLHREAAEKLNIRDPGQIYRNISTSMFQWAGFGRVEVQELAPDGGLIAVHDSFECELGKRRGVPYSHFVRGLIAGVLSELFGRGYSVAEEECIAKGDPACRFRVKAMPQAGQVRAKGQLSSF